MNAARLIFILSLLILVSCDFLKKEREPTSEHNLLQESQQQITHQQWIDTLNQRVENYSMNIYDPDKFLKRTIADTSRLNLYLRKNVSYGNYAAQSFALNMLGKNMLDNSNYPSAIQFHKQAYEAGLKAGNAYLEALSLNMMGVVYRRQSAIKTALEFYTRALRSAEESNDTASYMQKSIAISTEGIGGLYRALGLYEQAISSYKKSLRFEEQLGSLLGMAINNHNIGKTYALLGDYNSAIFFHERSLEYNYKINSVKGMAICYSSLGSVEMYQKNYEKAYQYLEPAFRLAKQSGDSTYIVNSFENLGWYHMVKHNHDSAYYYFSEAIAIADRIGYKAALLSVYNKLSELEEKRGNFLQALKYFKKANIYKDELANEKDRQYIVDLTILHDIENQKRVIENLEYNALLLQRAQKNKNFIILFLGLSALGLVFFIFQKVQTIKKNKIIHTQKEEMLKMQLELNTLQNERLQSENNQKEYEKQMLQTQLEKSEMIKQNELLSMQKELDHKNRELAAAASYSIKKSESMRAFLHIVEQYKQKENAGDLIEKIQNELKSQTSADADWEQFYLHFNEVHPHFFKNLKSKNPNLTTNDLRLCSYLSMNLSTKEIASLLFSSTESVEKAKYRLKKKLNIEPGTSLFNYLFSNLY